VEKTWRFSRFLVLGAQSFLILACIFELIGCGPKASEPEEVKTFQQAGPLSELKDGQNFTYRGPYRVVNGDILEFQMSTVLRVISADIAEWLKPVYGHKEIEPHLTRVDEKGEITLPIIGKVFVDGKTLAEIEDTVSALYYPKYTVNPPMIVCQVSKYRRENERVFTVMGLVNKPNAFPYPPDVQYNLMEGLAFAGGLDMIADPRYVKIFRQDASGKVVAATFSIEGKNLAEAYSVMIKPGDVIYIDHTLSTRMNRFLAEVLQIRFGADFSGHND